MATVYILYSQTIKSHYIGSCKNFDIRFKEHILKKYNSSFTAKANDWIVIFQIDNLSYSQARKIESHIKSMKSKKYIENLCKYPNMTSKLKEKY